MVVVSLEAPNSKLSLSRLPDMRRHSVVRFLAEWPFGSCLSRRSGEFMKSKLQVVHTRLTSPHRRLLRSAFIGFLFLALAAAGLQSWRVMLAASRQTVL